MNAKEPTADQLRHLIDRGRTGDRIAAIDPAAVPLGTDDEAAGTPPDRTAIESAIRQETGRGGSGPLPGRAGRPRGDAGPAMPPWAVAALIAAVCVAAAAATIAMM